MKGKIFKRVASAMLGLMVAFAAIGVNTAFADDDPTIKNTKPKIIVTNYQNDGTEAGSLVHCDVILVLTADEKFNGKEVEFDSVTYTVTFPESFIKSATTIYHQDLFPTTGYQQTFTLGNQNVVNGTIAKTDPNANSLKGTIGQNIPLARISFERGVKLEQTAKIAIKGVVTACKNGEATSTPEEAQTYNVTDCIHPSDKVTYSLPEDTTEAQKYHFKNCGDCNVSLIKEIHKEKGNIKFSSGNAETLSGQSGQCVCGVPIHKINSDIKGTEIHTPDGNDILGNKGLNAVEKEYFDNKGARCGSTIAIDVTNFYKGGKLDINTGSEDTVNGFYVWKNGVITVDGKNAAAPGKKIIFVARETDLPVDKFVELYKKYGGQGSVIPREFKYNGKRYICAWESGINPYFVPTSVAAEKKKEDPKKKGTQTKTGDAAGMVCLAASGLLVVAGLYMELMKKKKNA